MSVTAKLESGPTAEVSSNLGWRDFSRWVESLKGASDLKHLCEHGWDEDLDAVAKQLEEGLRDHPPRRDVKPIAEGLLGLLADRGDRDVLVVHSGIDHDGGGTADADP